MKVDVVEFLWFHGIGGDKNDVFGGESGVVWNDMGGPVNWFCLLNSFFYSIVYDTLRAWNELNNFTLLLSCPESMCIFNPASLTSANLSNLQNLYNYFIFEVELTVNIERWKHKKH